MHELGTRKKLRETADSLFSGSSFQNNMFPLVLKCCGPMKGHGLQKQKGLTNSQITSTLVLVL